MKKLILPATVGLLLFTALPARAIDFKAPIRALDGTALTVSDTDKTEITLATISTNALIASLPNENPPPSTDEKARRFLLAVKIQNAKDADLKLTAEEITTLKGAIGRLYGPLIVGRAIELLDPAAAPK